MFQEMSRGKSLSLFETFSGSMKASANFNEKQELFYSLEERFKAKESAKTYPR